MINEEIIKQNTTLLNSFLSKNKFKPTDCVVLEKNENSFLVPHAKESPKEFFKEIFSSTGPFWQAYNEMGLGEIPNEKEYSLFINNELYFCTNIQNEYVYTIGPKEKYVYKNSKLVKTKPLSIDYLIRTLSAPLDIISQTNQTIINAFRINEILPEISEQLKESEEYWERTKDKPDFEAHDAEYALQRAVKCMKYSFLVSLAYSLNLKPSEQINPLIEKTKQIHESIKKFQKGETPPLDIGYFGENIYDISKERFFDKTNPRKDFVLLELPNNEWMILRETLKIVCARYLAIQRKAYLSLAKSLSLEENIFYLTTKELLKIKESPLNEVVGIIAQRKVDFERNLKISTPNKIIYDSEKWFFENEILVTKNEEIHGLSVGAKTKAQGIISIVRNDEDLKKDFLGKIIVTSYFSPNLVVTYKSALGVISSVGGSLSHPAIVAREKNLPCIVQANIEGIKEGDTIEIDGEKGIARVINN
ncbi:MAG: PEP-utilizing enzyme [archaeon]|jgi:phosphohistidine swiveling domain-containing protein